MIVHLGSGFNGNEVHLGKAWTKEKLHVSKRDSQNHNVPI